MVAETYPWTQVDYSSWHGSLLMGEPVKLRQADLPRRWYRFFEGLGLRLHPAQWEGFAKRNRVKYYLCGRRWGKTVVGVCEVIRHMLETPRARVLYLAAHHDQLDEGIGYLRMLCEAIHEHEPALHWLDRSGSTRAPRIEFGDGTIYPSVFLREGKLRGRGYTMALIDEAELMEQAVFEYAIQPALGERRGELVLLSTPRGRSWLYEYVQKAGGIILNYPTWTNPMFPRDELEKAWHTWNRSAFRQEYGAELIDLVGRYFIQLPSVLHQMPNRPLIHAIGLDWGYDSPFCALWVAKDGEGNYYVYREVYERNLTEEAQVRAVLAGGVSHVAQIVADASVFRAPNSIAQLWLQAGLPHLEAATRDRLGSLSLVRSLLVSGRLFVIEGACPNLMRELEEAEVHPSRAEDMIGEDHAIDALRYAITALYPMRPASAYMPPEHTFAWLEWAAKRAEAQRWRDKIKW
jgi:hypothetical protein